MEIRKADSGLCDFVDVGGVDFAAETREVGEPEVVGDDYEEVGTFGGGRGHLDGWSGIGVKLGVLFVS